MASHRLLVVDPDERSRRLLEVSLRKAGYTVDSCADAEVAFARFLAAPPDLVIAETRLGAGDGFDLLRRLKQRPEGRHVPVVLLSSDQSVESKVRGLQWGAADYLTKPIYVRELLTRVQVELQRRLGSDRERAGAHFHGSLADMGPVDLLQTIEFGGKSGRLDVRRGERRAALWFDKGRILHAEADTLRGSEAVYHLLRWSEGYFDLRFEPAEPPVRSIEQDVQGLLLEGIRRLDEWERLVRRLPSLDAVLCVDEARLLERLAEIPDHANALLRSFDGSRDVDAVLRGAGRDELHVLETVVRLYEGGILEDTGRRSTVPPPPSAERLDERLAGALVPASEPPPRANGNGQEPDGAERGGAECATLSGGVSSKEADPLEDSLRSEVTSSSGTLDAKLLVRPRGASERGAQSRESPMPKRKGKKKRRKKTASARSEGREAAVIQFPNVAAGAEGELVSTEPTSGGSVRDEAPGERRAGGGGRAEEATGSHRTATSKSGPAEEERSPGEARRRRKKRNKDRGDGHAPEAAGAQRDSATDGEQERHDGQMRAESASGSPRTTSSQMIQALTATGEHAAVTEEFFQKPTDVPEAETWDDLEVTAQAAPPHERRARRVTLAIVAVGVAAIGGYVLVQKVFMPQPAAVGGLPPAAGSLPTLSEEALQDPDEPEEPNAALEPAVPSPPVADVLPSEAAEAEGSEAPAAAEAEGSEAPAAAEAEGPGEPAAAEAEGPGEPAAAETGEPSGDYAALLDAARSTRGARKRIQAFERALQADPDGVEALEELGFLHLNRGRMAEAIRYAERAVQVDPSRSKAWITLGAARQSRGDRQGAQEAYRRCVEQGKGKFVSECRRMVR